MHIVFLRGLNGELVREFRLVVVCSPECNACCLSIAVVDPTIDAEMMNRIVNEGIAVMVVAGTSV